MGYFYTSMRFGKTRQISLFKSESDEYRINDQCVIRSERGLEVGVVLRKVEPMPDTIHPDGLGTILRKISGDDLSRLQKNDESARRELDFCDENIRKLNLPMRLTDVDHMFGGDKIIFYFTAESRVDFRALVKILAQEFKARIELKQIGSRDEAKLCGDVGHCGKQLCCRGFLKELGGITMDMAKIQKHTADPSKITGMCGKLLCCLQYEYSHYLEAKRDGTPPPTKEPATPEKGPQPAAS